MTGQQASQPDPRDIANYTLAESARWLGLVPATLRVWLDGQRYRTANETRFMQPIIDPARRRPLGLSFWNLVECSVLAAMRNQHRLSLPKVRRALRFVAKEFGKKRPLIEQEFVTDGVTLFVERYGDLMDVVREGQVAMQRILQQSLSRIDRDEAGLAARLYPWSHRPDEPRVVALDPRCSFGRPVLASTGVTVDSLLGRFRAGERIEHLAEDYRVTAASIQDLIRWALEPAA